MIRTPGSPLRLPRYHSGTWWKSLSVSYWASSSMTAWAGVWARNSTHSAVGPGSWRVSGSCLGGSQDSSVSIALMKPLSAFFAVTGNSALGAS